MLRITRKQFDELCLTHEPIYIADEYSDSGKHWSVWVFNGLIGEYHQVEVDRS